MEQQYADRQDDGYLYGTVRDEVGEVDTVYVYPGERGRGLGSILLGAFISFCRALAGVRRVKAVMLPEKGTPISKLENFYQKEGFQRQDGTDTMWLDL